MKFGTFTYGSGIRYGDGEVWPITIPTQFLLDSFRDVEPKLTLSFETDIGPPMVRRAVSVGNRLLEGSMVLTLTEKQTLSAFYKDNCGSYFFFFDPDTGDYITVRFAEPPSYETVGGNLQKVSIKLSEITTS